MWAPDGCALLSALPGAAWGAGQPRVLGAEQVGPGHSALAMELLDPVPLVPAWHGDCWRALPLCCAAGKALGVPARSSGSASAVATAKQHLGQREHRQGCVLEGKGMSSGPGCQ